VTTVDMLSDYIEQHENIR